MEIILQIFSERFKNFFNHCMTVDQVLLVAGTHGNEINAPWFFDQWSKTSDLINTYKVKAIPVIGNPLALKKGRRYIDRDLNRSFTSHLLKSSDINDLEVLRAQELIRDFGPQGYNPSNIVIDFHSTTASMGTCLVVYGRRPVDLALVSLLQNRLGLPIYLHEGDKSQTGFLVESWPCGFVVEIGPVPQGLIHYKIIRQIMLTLNVFFQEISSVVNCIHHFPQKIIIHRHIRNIDFPRDGNGRPSAFVHPDIQGKDWCPISQNKPLFMNSLLEEISCSEQFIEEKMVPVFINEAAYIEKNIAMGLTKKEIWDFDYSWKESLYELINS